MNKDEALKLALDALEDIGDEWGFTSQRTVPKRKEAITAIKEALVNEALEKMAENARELGLDYEPEQEPVAWSHAGAMPPEQEVMKEAAYQLAPWLSAALDDPKVCKEYKDVINAWFDAAMPAPQRTWVGLTDEEKNKMAFIAGSDKYWLIRLVENKLKEKNETT